MLYIGDAHIELFITKYSHLEHRKWWHMLCIRCYVSPKLQPPIATPCQRLNYRSLAPGLVPPVFLIYLVIHSLDIMSFVCSPIFAADAGLDRPPFQNVNQLMSDADKTIIILLNS